MTPNSEYGVKEPMIHAGILTILHTYLGQATDQCLFSMMFSRPPASDSSKILSKQPLQHTGIDHKATCHVFDGIFQPGLNGISTRLT